MCLRATNFFGYSRQIAKLLVSSLSVSTCGPNSNRSSRGRFARASKCRNNPSIYSSRSPSKVESASHNGAHGEHHWFMTFNLRYSSDLGQVCMHLQSGDSDGTSSLSSSTIRERLSVVVRPGIVHRLRTKGMSPLANLPATAISSNSG